MNRNLQERISRTREALLADPRGILIGCLPPPAHNVEKLSELPSDYIELVALSDGIQCGESVFYASSSLDQHQPLANLLPGGTSRWLIVGHYSHQNIALDRKNGELHLFSVRDGDADSIAYERLDHFLDSVFGQKYLNLAGYQDDWYRLMVRLGFAADV